MGRGVRVGGGVVKYIYWDLSVNGHLGSGLSTAVSGYIAMALLKKLQLHYSRETFLLCPLFKIIIVILCMYSILLNITRARARLLCNFIFM